ncbi:MAG: hypothetical protein AB8G11_18465 [Saprospiraceae bacterium]
MKTIFLLFFSLTITTSITENTVLPYPDNSLYPEQYQELGMPKPEKIWNGSEYKRAVKAIKKFYNIDKWSLPRKNSDYSKILFERMTNIENFEIITDKSESLQERLREHDEILNGLNQFLNLYYEPNEKEQRFGAEVLSLLAVSAKSTEYSIEIINELQTMMSGRNMRNSDLDLMHDKLIAGVETTMEDYFNIINNDYKQYNQKDIEEFSTEITTWMVDVINYLNETQLTNIITQVTDISEKHTYNSVQKNFKSILKTLKKLQQQE